jgi:hypothetical protein
MIPHTPPQLSEATAGGDEIWIGSNKQALEEMATVVKPDTILAWHRKLLAKKFDGSLKRHALGRPQSLQSWRRWWCAWRRKTAAGVTIALLEP